MQKIKPIKINMPNYKAYAENSKTYNTIAEIFEYIQTHWNKQPSLTTLAAEFNYSEEHLQRLFRNWMGISPKKMLGYLTLSAAKEYLRTGHSVMDTAYDVGLSSPSRLHDLFLSLESMTPGEYKSCGRDMEIFFGWRDTPFGEALVMVSDRGLCGFAFVGDGGREVCFADMKRRWVLSKFIEDVDKVDFVMDRIFSGGDLNILLKGTAFQVQIWEALLRIPVGGWRSYGDLCNGHGRAVGGAVGANPISLLVPCHRVISGSGILNGYRWGLGRKVAILAAEGGALGVI